MDGNIRLSPNNFLGRVSELRRRALTSRILAKIEQQAKTGELDLEEIRGDLEAYDGINRQAFDPAEQISPSISFPELRAMDIHVEWLIDGLLPENSVTVLYGRTSIGKSWACLMIAEAVSAGLPIFGRATKQRPVVYIDMENPLTVMKDRAEALNMRSMNAKIWHSTMEPRPPKFDSLGWALYKTTLPSNALVIIDTSRSAHDGKENDSDVAALVMGRCRELRDMGMTVLILHHTPKANDRELKASGAWADLADHTICFFKSKGRDSEEEDGGEIPLGSPLCLGTGKKTRFAPSEILHMILTGHGLELTEDPETKDIKRVRAYIAGAGYGLIQDRIADWCLEEKVGRASRKKLLDWLKKGAGKHWQIENGLKNSKRYYPIEGSRT
jgi:hypothetical protein